MQIHRPYRHLLLAATVVIGIGAALAGTAAAKQRPYWEHPIYNDRQGWTQVDRNLDGRVSSQEWRWAQKHGYDRLNGVSKRHLTRAEYQRFLDAYLDRRAAQYRRGASQWAHRAHSPWYPSQQDGHRYRDD